MAQPGALNTAPVSGLCTIGLPGQGVGELEEGVLGRDALLTKGILLTIGLPSRPKAHTVQIQRQKLTLSNTAQTKPVIPP